MFFEHCQPEDKKMGQTTASKNETLTQKIDNEYMCLL